MNYKRRETLSLVIPVLALSVVPIPLEAKTPTVIPEAYKLVAEKFGIPAIWLYAVALTESGRLYQSQHRPWPWTLNIKGESYYFDSLSQAEGKLKNTLKKTSLVDIGLMQINWHWHSNRLQTVYSALNPINNLATGAAILAEQYRVCGNWPEAVGRYHSPGKTREAKQRAKSYRLRVHKQIQTL